MSGIVELCLGLLEMAALYYVCMRCVSRLS